MALTDIAFEDARDVSSISYRLHPLDVGFSLVTERMPVSILDSGDPELRASYAAKDGSRRVLSGPRKDVIARLRAVGYVITEGNHD